MALDASKVRRGITGSVTVLDDEASAPTSTSSALVGTDLGWISEDGVTRSMPGTGDRTVMRGWQNNGVIFVVRTPTDDNPTYSFVCLETKIEVIEFVLGVTVTSGATEGSFIVDTNALRTPKKLVFTVLEGEKIRRDYLPKAVVTEIGDQVFQFGEAIGWEVTVEAERDDDLGGNFQVWDTELKTPA